METERNLKRFVIPVTWLMGADVEVYAETLQDAIDIAQHQIEELPKDGEYIDSSWTVNTECANTMNDREGVKEPKLYEK